MQNLFTRFIKDESGATAIEYGLIAALISIALVAGAQKIGGAVNANFEDVATAMAGEGEGPGPDDQPETE